MTTGTEQGAEPQFVFRLRREFDAPRDLVWAAFTEADRLLHWWGPKDVKAVWCEVDLRPGGQFRYCLRPPEGADIWGRFVFREIVPKEQLVAVVSFTGEDGEIVPHPWVADWPLQVLSTIGLESVGQGRTAVSVEWRALDATAIELRTFEDGAQDMRMGWTGTFDQLDAYLAGVR